jgi:fructokinase
MNDTQYGRSKMLSQPLIFGEVLFDHFPDGSQVLGGGPFNVAWNLQGLGFQPRFVSAVGNDAEGGRVRKKMSGWGMELDGLQVNHALPTGSVNVALEEGQPTFDIVADRAYDRIEPPSFPANHHSFALLYYGSLAYRSEVSRGTMQTLIGDAQLKRFVDLNLRPPWFDETWLGPLLQQARWLKLNHDELQTVVGRSLTGDEQVFRAAIEVIRRYELECLFVTLGEHGALGANVQGEFCKVRSPHPTPFVDAVGAGDAFSAALIAGILREKTLASMMHDASQFAARICTIQGATSEDFEIYRDAIVIS